MADPELARAFAAEAKDRAWQQEQADKLQAREDCLNAEGRGAQAFINCVRMGK